MLKFIHKNQIHKIPKTKTWVIYYSITDIVLGFLLVASVAFISYKYAALAWNKNHSSSSVYVRAPGTHIKKGR